MMLPAPRLIILAMGAAPLFLAGAIYDPFAAVGVLYLFVLGILVVADLAFLPRRGGLHVERRAPKRASLGAATRIVLEVQANYRRRVEVRLAEDLPPHLSAEPAELAAVFDPGARGTLQYALKTAKRGRYTLSAIDVRVLPAMGLFYRQFRIEVPTVIDVFPNLVDLKRYELLLRRGHSYEGMARLRQIGPGSEFESLRPGGYSDDSSRIDWKATAKYSRLIVRNFQPERQQSVLLAIDCGRATAGEFAGMTRLDYFVNAAMMFAYVALRQGDWFSLVAFSDKIESYLPPVRQLKSIDRVARALYGLESRLVEADYSGSCRFLGLRGRKRGLVCLMTDVIDPVSSDVIVSYMARFARYHLPLIVTLADRDVRAVAEAPLASRPDLYSKAVALDVLAAREEALEAMRQKGVSVLDVDPHALTPELINRYLAIKSAHRL